jgi:hypothetical protein
MYKSAGGGGSRVADSVKARVAQLVYDILIKKRSKV